MTTIEPGEPDLTRRIAAMDPEQLPVADHELHGWRHFAGLYAAEHVAATEFVIGATFVAMGAGVRDVLVGLLIGNALAVASYWLITTPIAVQARLSLFTYLHKIAGDSMARIYNVATMLVFGTIAAAMITVSATAVRVLFAIPAQTQAYPTSLAFVGVCIAVGAIVVLVAAYGFGVLADFATTCAPWLMVMFTVGGMVLIPALAESLTGYTTLSGFSDFVDIAGASVWTGVTAAGQPGVGVLEVAGYAWAANTFSHFGLIDMAYLRYAKKTSYGLATSTGMLFGHYVAWISAGLMGAATAAITVQSIAVLDPGEVAYYALGATGFVIVIVAGWTTANANLYRAGLAAQAVMPRLSRSRVTLVVGIVVVIVSCFPVVFRNYLPLVTWSGLLLVPVGGIVFAEHHVLPRLGMTRFWASYQGPRHNVPALGTWALAIVFAVGLNLLGVIPYVFLFLPTWALAIVVYTLWARARGAGRDYREQEAAERDFTDAVRDYQAEQARARGYVGQPRDRSALTIAIRTIWVLALVIPAILGWRVLFDSPELYTYFVNRELFYDVTIWCTVVYFVFAWWDLRRGIALRRRHERTQRLEQAERRVSY
ncbi:purine-cytosine permease family protein [Piscicoccus intestinalis]|uniref:purine-cytosine permease family protein n=1 Tax=Piscicoccus intestinalis TaxID=746033 RepID=UPI000B33A10B|nr:hypothetical protein [Piscicoccus intestinalis]